MSRRDRVIPVHPNSTAARKWKRSTWRSTRNPWAEAAEARRAGDAGRAAALRQRAAREAVTEISC